MCGPRQLAELGLLGLELLLIFTAGEAAGLVNVREDGIRAACLLPDNLGRGRNRRRRLLQPFLQRGDKNFRGGKLAVAPVGGLDDVPWGVRCVGAAQRAFGGLDELGVELVVLPVVRRDAAHLLQFADTLLLLLPRQMQPEFHKKRAIVGVHFLEVGDAVQGGVEPAALGLAVDALDDRLAVPRAEENPDASAAGEGAPETPEFRAFALLVAQLPERMGGHAAGVEPLVQAVDQLAFARAVGAGYDEDDRKFPVAQVEVCLQQAGAQLGQRGIVGFFGQGVSQFGGV